MIGTSSGFQMLLVVGASRESSQPRRRSPTRRSDGQTPTFVGLPSTVEDDSSMLIFAGGREAWRGAARTPAPGFSERSGVASSRHGTAAARRARRSVADEVGRARPRALALRCALRDGDVERAAPCAARVMGFGMADRRPARCPGAACDLHARGMGLPRDRSGSLDAGLGGLGGRDPRGERRRARQCDRRRRCRCCLTKSHGPLLHEEVGTDVGDAVVQLDHELAVLARPFLARLPHVGVLVAARVIAEAAFARGSGDGVVRE
jgi:hypothetical protein